jgi:Icc-related predicted phosphoesterase
MTGIGTAQLGSRRNFQKRKNMTKICCASDLHGFLPKIPECDLLLIGGDICPDAQTPLQANWLSVAFRDWLDTVPAKEIVGVAGNHDIVFEKSPQLLPERLRWRYLEDDLVELFGFKIYGLPWITPIWGAFNRDEEGLARKYKNIPDDADIIISHGPPYGIRDGAPRRFYTDDTKWPDVEHCGSASLTERIHDIKPKLVLFGHIHEGYGISEFNDIIFVNASIMDVTYTPCNEPLVFEIEPK